MIVYKSRSLKGFCNNDWQCFTYNFTVIFDSDNNARQCLQYFYLVRCLSLHGVLPENGQDLMAGHLVTDLNLPQRESLLLRIVLYINHNQQVTGQQEMNFDL